VTGAVESRLLAPGRQPDSMVALRWPLTRRSLRRELAGTLAPAELRTVRHLLRQVLAFRQTPVMTTLLLPISLQ
jgi:hypothetical protein